MPAINHTLRTLLSNSFDRIISYSPPETRDKALNELIQANQLPQIRATLVRNKDFWNAIHPALIDSTGKENKDYYQTDDFLDDSRLKEIREEAAFRFFSMNMHKISLAHLERIFNSSLADCKEVLKVLGPQVGVNWGAFPDSFETTIGGIKTQAAQLYLKKFVEKSEDLTLVQSLSQAAGYADIINLGLPQSAKNILTPLLGPLPEDLRTAVRERLEVLKAKDAKQRLEADVANLSRAQLLGKNIEEYAAEYKVDSTWSRPFIAARCLEAQLNDKNAATLLGFLQSKSLDDLKGRLRTQNVREHDLGLITDNWGIRESVLRSYIKQLTTQEELLPLATPTDYKTYLNSKGVGELEHLKDDHKERLQQDARTQLFELAFGTNRPVLIKALRQLPVNKQLDLIKNEEQISRIQKATNEIDIERHLAAVDINFDAAVIQSLIKEKQQVDRFKRIQNSKVAQILSEFRPPISLTESMLKQINISLSNQFPNNALTGQDAANYNAERMANLSVLCKIKPMDEGKFNLAFGLEGNGAAKTPNQTMTAIINQQQFNVHLKAALGNQKHPRLLELFLAQNKQATLPQNAITTIENIFDDSVELSHFIDAITSQFARSPFFDPTTLKSNLTELLTDDLFHAIKNEGINRLINAENTVSGQPQRALDGFLDVLIEQLNDLPSRLNSFPTISDELDKISPVHLYNPLFRKSGRSDEREQVFQELANNCELRLNELNRARAFLSAYQLTPARLSAHRDKVHEIRTEIVKRIKEVDNAIAKELKRYDQLMNEEYGIIPAIKHAKAGDRDYVFHSNGFQVPTVRKKSQAFLPAVTPGSESKSEAPAALQVESHNETPSTPAEFLQLVPQLQKDEVRDFTYGEGAYKASYSEERCPEVAPPATPRSEDVELGEFRLFKMKNFPPANPNSGDSERIEFAMGFAAQILASRNGPPTAKKPINIKGVTNQDALKYVWTALIVLGETHPKMKFDHKAIFVNGKPYKPSTEISKWWGVNVWKFKDESLLKQKFTEQIDVENTKERYTQQMDAKFVPTAGRSWTLRKRDIIDEVQDNVKRTIDKANKNPQTQQMKEEMKSLREERGSAKPSAKEIEMRSKLKAKPQAEQKGNDEKHENKHDSFRP